MTEDKKEVWREVYTLADKLAINRERLKYLVEDIIGKRAETVEEANTVLSFLREVDTLFQNRLLTLDEAIEEAKREYKKKKDSKGEVQVPTDEEVEQIGEELEEEVRRKDIEEIKNLVKELGIREGFLEQVLETYGVKTLEALNGEQAEDLKAYFQEMEQEPIRGRPREQDDEVVEAEVVEGEEHWDKTVEIDEGTFMFREATISVAGIPTDVLLCKNGANDNVYELDVTVPDCLCPDFQINKGKNEYCKHLKAAKIAGYDVKELPAVPAEIAGALVKSEKEKRRKKAKKEEVLALKIMDKQVELPVQIPTELILSEEKAVETIKAIIGDNPKKEDVIMSYAGVTELSASVIISLAQYSGIRFLPIEIEEEKQRMNIGELYIASASGEQKSKYEAVAKLMGEVDITTRCKITTLSGWRDKAGNVRIGIGTKEEILTPHDLVDIVKRGASFIRTKAETKSARKSIINALPVTAEGILRKICRMYHWE